MKINMRMIGAIIGLAGMAAVGILYFASGLLAPGWAVICLMVVWTVLVALCIVWFRTRPLLVLAMPVIAWAIWWLFLTLGSYLFGWTA